MNSASGVGLVYDGSVLTREHQFKICRSVLASTQRKEIVYAYTDLSITGMLPYMHIHSKKF